MIRRRKEPGDVKSRFYETIEARGVKYVKATPSMILSGSLIGERVYFRDRVSQKPRVVTRRKNPLLGTPEQEFYTIIKTEKGITIGFPSVALVRMGEEISVYGLQSDEKQVVADIIEGEEMVFEIQD